MSRHNRVDWGTTKGASRSFTIFLNEHLFLAIKILCTLQVLVNMAPKDKENPTDNTRALTCKTAHSIICVNGKRVSHSENNNQPARIGSLTLSLRE